MMADSTGGTEWVLHVALVQAAANIKTEWKLTSWRHQQALFANFFQLHQTYGINYHKLLVIKCEVPGGFAIVNPFISEVCEKQIQLKTDT